MTIRPAGLSSMEMSKNTLLVTSGCGFKVVVCSGLKRGGGAAVVVLTLRATEAATIEDTARIDKIDRRIVRKFR